MVNDKTKTKKHHIRGRIRKDRRRARKARIKAKRKAEIDALRRV